MSATNPYTPPAARVTDATVEVSDQVLKNIKNAWVAAVISGAMTLLITVLAMVGMRLFNISAWGLIDVALLFGLAYGIYRKSRTCAVIIFIYFVGSKILMMRQAGASGGIVLGLVFAYYFWMGIVGTFAYHKAVKAG